MSSISLPEENAYCFVIFGASGDLAMRMLIPSLVSIGTYTKYNPRTRFIGIARTEFKPGELEARYTEGVKQYGRLANSTSNKQFLDRFSYITGDYNDEKTYARLAQEIAKQKFVGVLIYFATPPSLIEPISINLGKSGISRSKDHWTRLVIEKPFGYDLKTAQHLNELIHRAFDEDQIFRIDHYLAKETVMNIFTLRWGNTIWEPLWNRNYISHIEIIVAESVGVGNRAGYYEGASVLRDMIQNHLVQMMTIIAMEPPTTLNANSIRDEKVKVLEAVRKFQQEDFILGQYVGYHDEPGVAPDSYTSTLAVVRFYIDNWRWEGVPFFLISGKALKEKQSTIKIVFNKVPHQIFGENTIDRPNVLKIKIQPKEGITLKQHVKIPGAGLMTQQIPLSFSYQDKFGDKALVGAYERVIVDAINGDQSFFPRSDEIEKSWKIVEPMLGEHYFVAPYAKGLDIRCGAIKRNIIIHPTRNYFTNGAEFVSSSAEQITRIIVDSIAQRGICNMALAGGLTPKPILVMLATSPYLSRIDVKKLHMFFVDERCVPPDDKQSNYRMAKECFFDYSKIPPENIHRVKGEIDPQEAAAEYAKDIETHFGVGVEPIFDLITLGFGADSHVASFFPGLPAIKDKKSLALAHYAPQVEMYRVTLGIRVINNARNVMINLQGKEKEFAFTLVRAGPYVPSLLPAQAVRPKHGQLTWNILL